MKGYIAAIKEGKNSNHHDGSDDDDDDEGTAAFDFSAAQSQMLALASLFNTLVDFTKQVNRCRCTCRYGY